MSPKLCRAVFACLAMLLVSGCQLVFPFPSPESSRDGSPDLAQNEDAITSVKDVGAADSRPDLRPDPGPITCTTEGWCQEYFQAPGRPLRSVWGSSSSDIYAVGQRCLILHDNGSGWMEVDSGTEADLEGVWGSGPEDVFVVGSGGIILHFNGSTWTEFNCAATGHLFGIWGRAIASTLFTDDFRERSSWGSNSWIISIR